MKFKVGDNVKSCETGSIIGEVIETNSGPNRNMYLCKFPGFDGHRGNGHTNRGRDYSTDDYWYLSEWELELLNPETITIYRKDNEVIALDKSTGKKAIARCCPEDTFDFETGAKLAFDRLLVNNKYGVPNVREVKRMAKVGEYIKIVNPSGGVADEYKKGDILKVVTCSGSKAYYKNEIWKYASPYEYVVLEGYKPEEPKKPEKQPYNGKIIFTKGDDVFKTGHIYEIKDGKITLGKQKLPYEFNGGVFHSIEDVRKYFNKDTEYGWRNKNLELIEVVDD